MRDLHTAFEEDALNSSHPLSVPLRQIQMSSHILEMFDAITYCKVRCRSFTVFTPVVGAAVSLSWGCRFKRRLSRCGDALQEAAAWRQNKCLKRFNSFSPHENTSSAYDYDVFCVHSAGGNGAENAGRHRGRRGFHQRNQSKFLIL